MKVFEEVMVCGEVGFIHKHASIEVKGRLGAKLSRPGDLVRALLAVANLVLWSVAPCFLTKAILHSIEVVVWKIKEVVYVFKNLNVSIKVNHLTILHKLQFQSEATSLVYLKMKLKE